MRGRSAPFVDPSLTALQARHVWLPDAGASTLIGVTEPAYPSSKRKERIFLPSLPSLEHILIDATGRQHVVLRANQASIQLTIEGANLTARPVAKVRRKALAVGETGLDWLARLDGLVCDLASDWGLSVGRTLPGGTEALVVEVMTAEGLDGALKIAIPGLDPAASELRTLLAAQGRGDVRVLRHDETRCAMLLERLGAPLNELGLPINSQIQAICATLLEAWAPLPEGAQFVTGAQKASSLADFIEGAWRQLGQPWSSRTVHPMRRRKVQMISLESNSRAFGCDKLGLLG